MIEPNRRLLIVDDNTAIHDDFRKILGVQPGHPDLAAFESSLFDAVDTAPSVFEITAVAQGEEALDVTRRALAAGQPFAVAFVDIRMPPGIDGVQTARRLWQLDPELPIVLCTAHSDYSWSEMTVQLGAPDRWLLLKKPFDNVEVRQLAAALVEKRALQQVANIRRSELERLVAERTEKLAGALHQLQQSLAAQLRAEEERRQLEQKLERAQRLESLGVLAGGIAHDFNNLLAGILGRASLARLGAPPEEMTEHMRAIELCARRAAELCEQMLAYAGHGHISSRDVDIDQLVQEMDSLVRASVPRDVQFSINLSGAGPIVRGDPSRLRQVVMNLVINGAEALEKGERKLALQTTTQRLTSEEISRMLFSGDAAEGDYVLIRVEDSGAGISPENLNRIFEPFFTTKFEGRGLGLCAVVGIVRSHGGALDVTSALGHGSVFRVFLPLASLGRPAVPPPFFTTTPPRGPSSGRLLVVDDEECVRTVAMHCLRRHGYTVETASDGAEAVQKFRDTPDGYDGIVIDFAMPRLDGAAALRAIRERRPDLPAVLMSGFDQGRISDEAPLSPHTAVLQKPFEIDQLCAVVDDMFLKRTEIT